MAGAAPRVSLAFAPQSVEGSHPSGPGAGGGNRKGPRENRRNRTKNQREPRPRGRLAWRLQSKHEQRKAKASEMEEAARVTRKEWT